MKESDFTTEYRSRHKQFENEFFNTINNDKEKVWEELQVYLPKRSNNVLLISLAAASIALLLALSITARFVLEKKNETIAQLQQERLMIQPVIYEGTKVVSDTVKIYETAIKTKYKERLVYDTVVQPKIIHDTVFIVSEFKQENRTDSFDYSSEQILAEADINEDLELPDVKPKQHGKSLRIKIFSRKQTGGSNKGGTDNFLSLSLK